MILEYLIKMAKLHKAVSILSIGNLVSISVKGTKEPIFVVPCASCESADVLSDLFEKCYDGQQIILA